MRTGTRAVAAGPTPDLARAAMPGSALVANRGRIVDLARAAIQPATPGGAGGPAPAVAAPAT